MTSEREFDALLRSWFEESAPSGQPPGLLESVVTATSHTRPRPAWLVRLGGEPMPETGQPGLNRFAPLALAATAVVVAILVGIGLLARSLNVGPSPVPGPTHRATPVPNGPLGGGLILVHEAYDPSNPGPLDVFTLDAGSGQETLLGTVQPIGGSSTYLNRYSFQWGADRKHVLITHYGQGPIPLDNQSDAGRELTFVCCEPPGEVRPNTEKGDGTFITLRAGTGWVLSPQNDRIAGLHDGQLDIPGCLLLLCSAPNAVVVADVDGKNLRTLPLPEGSQASTYAISWSPDGSVDVVAGCRSCNKADLIASASGGIGDPGPDLATITPTAVEHAHLFFVPVDGSPVRELLDETETGFWSAVWSPDGTTIAFGRNECPPDEHAPYCQHGTLQLLTMSVADGQQTVVADVSGDRLVWSPDGRRIAFGDQGILVMDADGSHLAKVSDGFEPHWSPDGKWLLFSTYDQPLDTTIGPWIVAADGGVPRLLGPYGGWAW